MNRITGKVVTLLLSAALGSMISAGVESPFEVGTWENFCQGAISHTFDDYPSGGATRIVTDGREAFDEKNFHMTMFVVSGEQNQNSWAALKSCFEGGHEVGSHNSQHTSSFNDGLAPSQAEIRSNIPGELAVSFAYPNGAACDDNKINSLYIAARDAWGGNGVTNSSPSNFAHIVTLGFGYSTQGAGYSNDANSMNSFAEKARDSKGWAVAMHHGIGADTHSWATTSLDAMKSHLEYLDNNRDKIWCETFGNVARYIKERDAASLTVESSSESEMKVSLTDNLADSIFNYPLTIRRPLPDGWGDSAVVTQDGNALDDSIVTVDSKKYIMFKAVPDGGDIVISSGVVSVNRSVSNVSPVNPVVLNKSSLTINPEGFAGSAISVSLFDLRGKLVFRYSYSNRTSPISVPLKALANSAFVVKITDGKTTVVNRCLSQM